MTAAMTDTEAKVLDAIAKGNRTNATMQVAIAGQKARGGYDRQIDAAIQKLRKRGAIVLRDRKWFVADEAKPCSRCHGTGKEPTP